jgi:hypothetical protein
LSPFFRIYWGKNKKNQIKQLVLKKETNSPGKDMVHTIKTHAVKNQKRTTIYHARIFVATFGHGFELSAFFYRDALTN